VAMLFANFVVRPTFTEVGHLTAFLVGLAAIPLAPDRDAAAYPALLRSCGVSENGGQRDVHLTHSPDDIIA
jgi:hypothetical protein